MRPLPLLLTTLLSLSLPTLSTANDNLAGLEIDNLTPDITCTRKSQSGDYVSVHYTGILWRTSEQFDSSYGRGKPLDFELGAGRVIKGWDEGLKDMCVGEKRRLIIPAHLGYGARTVGPIPANSVLVFETELVGIKGVGKDEL
jgi:FK506-binding protein 2